jgi:hypothetical protein
MDYEEFVKMSEKARRETEDFINHYIHDQGKRWPLICRPAPGSVELSCPAIMFHRANCQDHCRNRSRSSA